MNYPSDRPYPTIQAVDEHEGTVYTLSRPGLPSIGAAWPHPLMALCPEAVFLPSRHSDGSFVGKWGPPE